jgi:hypothetical protein
LADSAARPTGVDAVAVSHSALSANIRSKRKVAALLGGGTKA